MNRYLAISVVPPKTSLAKQVLRYEYYVHFAVITVIGEDIAHVPRISLVQQVVQHDQFQPVPRLFL